MRRIDLRLDNKVFEELRKIKESLKPKVKWDEFLALSTLKLYKERGKK